jgi:hypothetical protein
VQLRGRRELCKQLFSLRASHEEERGSLHEPGTDTHLWAAQEADEPPAEGGAGAQAPPVSFTSPGVQAQRKALSVAVAAGDAPPRHGDGEEDKYARRGAECCCVCFPRLHLRLLTLTLLRFSCFSVSAHAHYAAVHAQLVWKHQRRWRRRRVTDAIQVEGCGQPRRAPRRNG